MRTLRFPARTGIFFAATLVLILVAFAPLAAQERPRPPESPALRTPLSQAVLELLANEISGQLIFANEVKLAGAPWTREEKELTDTFYETRTLYDIIRGYGIETARIDRYKSAATFEYPKTGEFWMLKPEKKLIARLDADPALVSRGSAEADVTGTLIYLPPLTGNQVKAMAEGGSQDKFKDKIALMWSHANQATAKALDAAGVRGVITFSAQDRYLDPDQVIYSGGMYAGFKTLQFGMTVSWRQWSELLEDVEKGTPVTVQCKTKLAKYPDRFESVLGWIPGKEPEAKGVVFTGHLFEGYVKRGANDDMSGVVVELEILRALSKLIAKGDLPQPRRTITFLWPNEISGTYEFIRQNPGFADRLSININMDMVGESLRLNNGLFTMSECPNYLPSYLDGLAGSVMNYVWRTNDIVYLPDAPRARLGGQVFPRPIWEKNGSRDAFRYYIHQATGGSDHICFNNPSVAVPGVEFFTWPDQWYHTDKDTPDKSDPTEMKRVAFIGAAAAWAAANCTDDVLPGLLDAAAAFGYERVGKRELPAAYRAVDRADAKSLAADVGRALRLVDLAAGREKEAVASVREIFTGSPEAARLVANREAQLDFYRKSLAADILAYGNLRAKQLGAPAVRTPAPDKLERQYGAIIPALQPDVRGKEFALESSDRYKKFLEKNPDALKDFKLDAAQRRAVLNYINGRRSAALIRDRVAAETDRAVDFAALVKYLDILKAAGWVK
jgi:aminopeptidase YwaD